MPITIHSKLPDIGTTIFTIMSKLAIEHQAINVGQGFPDFDPSPKLVELVHAAMQDGHNQYAFMAGLPALREEISKKTTALYGHCYNPDTEITITNGATESIMTTILALVGTGDEAIVLEPFYDSYVPAIRLAGGTPITVPMTPPSPSHPQYRIDWQRIRDAITAKTRMLVINFPNNPTGIALESDDLDALESIVSNTNIAVLSDEAYEHIVFDGRIHYSIATREKLAANAIIVSSFAKTYHVTGWKIGYSLAPANITSEIRKVHQFNVFSVSSPMQPALAQFMKDPNTYSQLSAFYQKKRDHFTAGLARSRFKPLASQGTFFLLADYSEISDETEVSFAKKLTSEYGVTVIPVAAFYGNPNAPESNHHLVRICFAKKESTLDAALERLRRI